MLKSFFLKFKMLKCELNSSFLHVLEIQRQQISLVLYSWPLDIQPCKSCSTEPACQPVFGSVLQKLQFSVRFQFYKTAVSVFCAVCCVMCMHSSVLNWSN